MKNFRIIAGYILIIFPPVYGLRLLLDPETFFYKYSANAPLVVAATLVLVMILSMAFSFGLYLLKKK